MHEDDYGPLTPADAGALTEIMRAVQAGAIVARLDTVTMTVHWGKARYIGSSPLMRPNHPAEAKADIRGLYLRVRTDPDGHEEAWQVGTLIALYHLGAFMANFDVEAFEAAGGQASVPESVAAWRAAGWTVNSTSAPSDRSEVSPEPRCTGYPVRSEFGGEIISHAGNRRLCPVHATAPATFAEGQVVEYFSHALGIGGTRGWSPAIFERYASGHSEITAYIRQLGRHGSVIQVRLDEIRDITEMVAKARAWALECEWIEDRDEIADLDDVAIVRGIQRWCAGGWRGFCAAEDPQPARRPS